MYFGPNNVQVALFLLFGPSVKPKTLLQAKMTAENVKLRGIAYSYMYIDIMSVYDGQRGNYFNDSKTIMKENLIKDNYLSIFRSLCSTYFQVSHI